MEPEIGNNTSLKEKWNNWPNKKKKIVKILIWAVAIYLIINMFSDDKTDTKKQNTSQIETNDKWANYDSGVANKLELDVDAVQKALRDAKGPQDFEKRVNKIYTGDDIISINVQDKGNQNQIVYLYIDKEPKNGKMEENEKILSLDRILNKDSGQVQIQSQGYGPYQNYSYTSPLVYGLVSGLTNYWIMSSLMYNTPMSRYGDIRNSRDTYRKTPEYKSQKTQAKTKSANRWSSKSGSSGSWNRGSNSTSGAKSSGSNSSRASSGNRWGSSSSSSQGSRSFFNSGRSSSRGFFSK